MAYRTRAAGIALAAALSVGAGPALAQTYDMVIYGTTGNPFWAKVVAGAEEAGEVLDINVNIQFANDDPVQQNTLVESAIARGSSGIGVVLNIDDAYDDVVAEARAAGIPVIAFNVDDSQGAAGNERMAFIGQDFEVAGHAIGRTLIEHSGIGEGDQLVCPVEHPEATYAVQRGAGVQRALEEVGASCDVIGTGAVSLEETLTRLVQYLVANPGTAGIVGLGGMPTEVAPQAIAEAGMDLPVAGFDLTQAIVEAILDGDIIATVDQQPFYQGFMTVVQLHYYQKYGLVPMDINTGAAIITADNAQPVLDFSDTVR